MTVTFKLFPQSKTSYQRTSNVASCCTSLLQLFNALKSMPSNNEVTGIHFQIVYVA